MAQLVEQLIRNQQIVSSSLTGGSRYAFIFKGWRVASPYFLLVFCITNVSLVVSLPRLGIIVAAPGAFAEDIARQEGAKVDLTLRMGAANMDPVDFLRKVTFSKLYANGREQGNAQQLNQDEDFSMTPEESLALGQKAVERAITEKANTFNAMWREDVGPISILWGTPGKGKKFKKGYGISHIIAGRNVQGLDGETIARKMPEVLAYGKITRRQNEGTIGERVFIGYDSYTAILSLFEDDNRKTWLLTGWIDDESGAQSKGYDSESATNNEVTLTHLNDGAETSSEESIYIRDAIRKELNQGENNPRGATRIYPETYLIKLFDGANLSTLLHETGHVFFEEMSAVVESGVADQAMVDDFTKLRQWLGAADGATLTTEQREQAARGFEVYLMEGKAPTAELDSVFARFRRWLTRIYQSVMRLNAPLTDEVRQVFGRMISIEQEVNQAADNNSIMNFTTQGTEKGL